MHLRILIPLVLACSAISYAQQGFGATVYLNPVVPPNMMGAPVPGDVYQVRYFSNLNIGDSYINITNAGTNGAGLFFGIGANVNGSICANVYAFSKDEQLVACCSCPVTPNGLFSLSVQKDIINNVLSQQAIPTSITVKLTSTQPVGGSCNGSAFAGSGVNGAPASTPPTYISGMVAWATTLHANSTVSPVAYGLTETRFVNSILSVGEQSRLTQLCTFINGNGSGAGLCNTCKPGGLAASKQ